jgi:hypothetical protein
MKTKLNLLSAAMSLAFVLPAWAAGDPPAAQPAAQSSPAEQAKAAKEPKRSVTPHNHMRDAKGIWVADKKPRKANKNDAKAGAKDAASSEAAK